MTRHAGLGHAHRKRREELLPSALGTICPLQVSAKCTVVMVDPQLMELDHTIPRVLGGDGAGDRIVCSSCNRSAGATLGNRLRGLRRLSSSRW